MNEYIFKSISCDRYTLENMAICEERPSLWCCGVYCIDFILFSGTPAIKWHCVVECSLQKFLPLLAPDCNLLRKMFRKKSRLVRNGKVWSQGKNKFDEKLAIHERPWKHTANEHAEHEPLDLDFLLFTDFSRIHVFEDASGWLFEILLRGGSFVSILELSWHLIQVCWMCTPY